MAVSQVLDFFSMNASCDDVLPAGDLNCPSVRCGVVLL